MLASGCFKQLPPVPSAKDPGHHAFKSDIFKNVFPHQLHLTQVVRQNEADLITAVNELCNGTPSQTTENLLHSLKRPLMDYSDAVYISGTNQDCSYLNELKLDKIESAEVKYYAIDDEEASVFKSCKAPRVLVLKQACRIIVTRNLTNGLVNGISGTVIGLHTDNIDIKVSEEDDFPHKFHGRIFTIDRYTFLERDDNDVVKGVRKQFPLKLGYAITVDKSQGRSLKKLVVDCHNFWRPGQLGVAIGRAISKEGLQRLNYNPITASLSHGDRVNKFCHQRGIPIRKDTSCCKVTMHETTPHIQYPIPQIEDDRNYEFGDLPNTRSNVEVRKKFPWDVRDFIPDLCRHKSTPNQVRKNQMLTDMLLLPRMKYCLQDQYTIVHKMCNDYKIARKGCKCNLCFMTTHIDRYLT